MIMGKAIAQVQIGQVIAPRQQIAGEGEERGKWKEERE
jgi:hypothetical protein